jgi:hypothetical protein
MDWSLMDPKHGFLRAQLMYERYKYVYYIAIVVDLFLRFAWTFTLIPAGAASPLSPKLMQYVTPCLAAGEILRRTMWGCFRLENEHLKRAREAGNIDQLGFIPSHLESEHGPKEKDTSVSGNRVLSEVLVLISVVLGLAVLVMVTE